MLPSSAAALRNRDPIADVLARALPRSGLVLEIASGTGEHVEHFARRFPGLTFQPTEATEPALVPVTARAEGLANVRRPVVLDVLRPWPVERADAVVCINMIHASVPEAMPALVAGAGRVLPAGGVLVTYGPYRVGGAHTAPSNEEFDRWLRTERDPRFGVRDREAVEAAAQQAGLDLVEAIAMPANNFSLVFRRRGWVRLPTNS